MNGASWMQNYWFRLLLFSAFCFLLGFSYKYHLPKIESFLLIKLEDLSQRHLPVRIWAKNLHFHLLPLGVVLEDVRILPQFPANRYLAPAEIKEVGARLAIFPLLRGEVRLGQIFIRNADLSLFVRPELLESKDKAPTKLDFDQIYRLPIDEISLEHVRLKGKIEPRNVVFLVDDFNLMVENRYRSLFVELDAPSVLAKPSGNTAPLDAQIELRTLIESQEAQVSAFKLKMNDSFAVASGRIRGDLATGKFETGAFEARSKLRLSDINSWEKALFAKPLVPRLLGRAETNIRLQAQRDKGFKLDAELNTEDVQVDVYKIGKIKGHLTSDLNAIQSDHLEFENSAGKAQFKNVALNLREQIPSVTGDVHVENIELKQFLENIDVKGVPVLLHVNGDAKCHGLWTEKPALNCHAQMSSPRLWIYEPAKKSTIVEAQDFHGQGDVTITLNDVLYKAEVSVGKSSSGRSHGLINYETGFKIFYDTDNLNLADVKNLADLKLEGKLKINGSTEGTATWATLDMNVEGNDFWLEDYPFGRLNSKMKYKVGHLLFNSVQGQYATSQYNGSLDLDLHKKELKLHGDIPFADLHDLQQVFQRKIVLPFTVAGTGQGQIEARGPLRLSAMTYKVHSSFFRGEVAGENFDELVFNVSAKDGLVKSDRINLTKSSGVAEAKGQITPKGEIDTVVVARGLRLEQSENVRNYGLDLQGLADFTVLIRGQLPQPRIELNGRLSRVILADQPAEDSIFKLNFLQDRLEGSGQFFGSRILADVTYPYNKEGPFFLRLGAKKWDFTSLFTAISKSAQQLDFSNSVSGSIQLSAPRGGFWASSGQVKIDEFILRKGAKSLTNHQPMFLNFHNGEINSNNVAVTSGDSYIKLDAVNFSEKNFNASLNGKLDVSLLGILTPFISDLRGNTALTIDLRGSLEHPTLSGSAYVDKGYAKFTDFIHPFSNVRADVLFNDNQIHINSVRCDIAGGHASGDGRITFADKMRKVDVHGVFSDVKLNVPTGFHSQGSGKIGITGNKFPYTLSVEYAVNGGEVVYDIGDDNKDRTTSIKPSPYLPHFLNQESFHPFTFNVDADLKSPITVNNNLALAQVNGRISANGTPDKILLNGTLTPQPGGKLFFHDTPFEITAGYAEYVNAPPTSPKIYLTATTRKTEVSQDEQLHTKETTYDINMLVQGKGPVPQIALSSQPPLSEREIVSLLALGLTTANLDERNPSDRQAANTSSAIGAALLKRAGEKSLKENLGVEVKVSTQPTPDTASSPKVTFSKQLTPKFGASASSTIQANPANSARLEYKVNKNISVIGGWDGREYTQEQISPITNVFGLDLEYKMQFK